MRITNLEVENILSIDKACVSFGETGLVLVEGFDFDTNRANGAGKSAIFNAISFGLFDKIPRKITKSEILRYGTKSGFSMVTVITDSGETLCVKRSRPTLVEFFKDGLKIELTQVEFEAKLGINYEQFLSTMYNAQDSADRFISLDDRGKKDFILKMMNLESFDAKKKALSAELQDIAHQKSILSTKLEGLNHTLSIGNAQMVDVSSINEKIKILESECVSHLAKLKEVEAVSQPDLSKYAELEAQIENKLYAFASLRFNIDQRRKDLLTLKNSKPTAHCPQCDTGLNAVNGKLVKATDEALIQEQISSTLSEISSLEEQLLKEVEVKELQRKIKQKKTDEYQEFNNAQIEITKIRNVVTYKMKDIQSLKDQISKNDLIKEKIQMVLDGISETQAQLITLTSEEDIIKTVASFFDPSGAPAYIMDSVLDSFNDAVSDYVAAIWPSAVYGLQSYKENKDKTISTKFSESLVLGGKQTSVGSLSGGEFRALSLATDFAMIDVMCNKFSIDLNPIILDEPFNGLDSAGKELVIELLDRISTKRQVWVVDHTAESKALFSRVVRVEKKNGISDIKDI